MANCTDSGKAVGGEIVKDLLFVKWHTKHAVYCDGKLIYHGEQIWDVTPFLEVLGYCVLDSMEIPTHDIPDEFDLQESGHWQPPEALEVLQDQIKRWKDRLLQEKIASLKEELARLVRS